MQNYEQQLYLERQRQCRRAKKRHAIRILLLFACIVAFAWFIAEMFKLVIDVGQVLNFY